MLKWVGITPDNRVTLRKYTKYQKKMLTSCDILTIVVVETIIKRIKIDSYEYI